MDDICQSRLMTSVDADRWRCEFFPTINANLWELFKTWFENLKKNPEINSDQIHSRCQNSDSASDPFFFFYCIQWTVAGERGGTGAPALCPVPVVSGRDTATVTTPHHCTVVWSAETSTGRRKAVWPVPAQVGWWEMSRSLKVKSNGPVGLPLYVFLLMFNSNSMHITHGLAVILFKTLVLETLFLSVISEPKIWSIHSLLLPRTVYFLFKNRMVQSLG